MATVQSVQNGKPGAGNPRALFSGAKIGVLSAVVSGCLTTFAGGTLADPAVGGDWNADATWTDGVRPAAGEAVTVTPTANAKVTLSADDATDYASLYFRAGPSASSETSLEFDGQGHNLRLPQSADGHYGANPFRIFSGNGGRILYAKGDAQSQLAVAALDNAHFLLAQTNGATLFAMDRGLLNFYDPDGTSAKDRLILLGNGSGNDAPTDFLLRFTGSSYLRAYNVRFCHSSSSQSALAFDGGAHEILGTLSTGHDNLEETYGKSDDIDITGTANVTVSNFTASSWTFSNGKARRVNLNVKDGGTLTLGSARFENADSHFTIDNANVKILNNLTAFVTYWDSNWTKQNTTYSLDVNVVNGGALTIGGNYTSQRGWHTGVNVLSNSALRVGGNFTSMQYYQTGAVVLSDSELSVGNSISFGQKGTSADCGVCAFYATNATVEAGGAVCFYQKTNCVAVGSVLAAPLGLTVDYGSDVTFRDSAVFSATNANATASYYTFIGKDGDACVRLDGGTMNMNIPVLGVKSGKTGRLVVDGGAEVATIHRQYNDWSYDNMIGVGGSGYLDIINGTVKISEGGYTSIYLGANADGYGEMNIHENGEFYIYPGTASWQSGSVAGTCVGKSGVGRVNVTGGLLSTPMLVIGQLSRSSAPTSTVCQTGGRVLARSSTDTAMSCVSMCDQFKNWYDRGQASNHKCAYYLNGGVLETLRIYGGLGSLNQGGTGYSLFSLDGGTFRVFREPNSNLPMAITGLDRCEFGAKGGTLDTVIYAMAVNQDFVNKDGARGRVVKAGTGTLTYSGACSVSELVVSNGTWLVTDAATISSDVRIEKGGTFSLVGSATGLTLPSLAVTNGTLKLDPGDVITVSGDASFDGLTLTFSTAPTKDEAQTVLIVNGTLDDASAAALKIAYSGLELADGTHLKVTVEKAEGVTTVKATVKDDVSPIGAADTVSWTGTGSWSTAANWTPAAVPTETKKAAFASETAGKEVAVDTSARVGALTFGADGHTLAGAGPIEIVGEQGAAQIEATAGANAVNVPMTLGTDVKVPVAAGANLALNGNLTSGGLEKTGTGTLTLGGANHFAHAATLREGTTVVTDENALGTADSPLAGCFRGGVLRFDGDGPMTLANALTLDGTSSAIYDLTSDATVNMTATKGAAIYKRGIGTLTLPIADATTVWTTKAKTGSPAYSESLTYNEDGTVTTSYMPSMMLTEGKTVIKSADGTMKTLNLSGNVMVGTLGLAVAKNPELVLDNVKLVLPGETSFNIGYCQGTKTAAGEYNAKLTMLNAYLSGHNICFSDRCTGGGETVIAVTNSTVEGRYALYPNGMVGSHCRILSKDSTFTAQSHNGFASFSIRNKVDFDFDRSNLRTSNGGSFKLCFDYDYSGNYPEGKVAFRNGTTLSMGAVYMDGVYTYAGKSTVILHKPFEMIFDDATWDYGSSDITITSTVGALPYFTIRTTGGGLILPTPSGTTFHTDAKVVGEGGIEKSGEGTLAFGPGAYQFTGPMCALAGTVDLTNAGAVTNACFTGSGTVRGGTLVDACIVLDDLAPHFESCTFSGKCKLDVGETRPKTGASRRIATYTGLAPDVSGWRLTGKGKRGVKGTFTAANGEIWVTFRSSGFIVVAW